MEDQLLELMIAGQRAENLALVLGCNETTRQYGLELSEEEAKLLLAARTSALKEQRRVEFSEGILPKLVQAFCDSPYLEQSSYAETLAELQDLFYYYKNESQDLLTDDELLTFMREQFDEVCFGSTEYLAGTCLERFARAIRAGYRSYEATGGRGEYAQFSEEDRWDRELFFAALEALE